MKNIILIFALIFIMIKGDCKFGSKPGSEACCSKNSIKDFGCTDCDHDTGVCIKCANHYILNQATLQQHCLFELPRHFCNCRNSQKYACVLWKRKARCKMVTFKEDP